MDLKGHVWRVAFRLLWTNYPIPHIFAIIFTRAEMDWIIGVFAVIVIFGVNYLYVKFVLASGGPDWENLRLLASCVLGGLALIYLISEIFS